MPQGFRVDRGRLAPYLGLLLAACTPSQPGSIVPMEAQPISRADVQSWVEATAPSGHLAHRFRWQVQDDRGSAGGRGTARVARPDSLRLDVVGPLGSGRGAGVVVGDSAQWAEPPDVLERLIVNYPLMWAMLGVMREPPAGAVLRGARDEEAVRWEWALGADTVAYRWDSVAGQLAAQARSSGVLVGRVETSINAEGRPTSSRLTVPRPATRISLTFTETTPAASFSPDLWAPPAP